MAAPGDAHQMRERLQQMETDFRSTRQQQQQPPPPQQQCGYQLQQHAAGAKERGAGDWANYQPPSAVLAAVQQRQQQQQYAQPPGPPAAPAAVAAPAAAAAAAPASSLPLKKDLPPALKARLAARGILPKEDGAAGSSGSGSEGECCQPNIVALPSPACLAVLHAACPLHVAHPLAAPSALCTHWCPTAEALPPGWQAATDPTYQTVYYYNAATGERSWTRPAAAVGGDRSHLSARLPASPRWPLLHELPAAAGPGLSALPALTAVVLPPMPASGAAATGVDRGQGPGQRRCILLQCCHR